jgi:L-fucose isomerase-like protein
MKARTMVLTVTLCVLAVTVAFASDPNRGTWKLNEAKSKGPSTAPKNNTVVYEAAGDDVKGTVDGTDAESKSTHNEWTGQFDGKDYPLSFDPAADTRSYKKIDARTTELTTEKGGKATATGRIVVSTDLSEVFGRIAKLKDDHAGVQEKLADIRKYVTTSGVPDAALVKMAKLGYVIDDWMKQTDVKISAVQCWTSMEEYFGVVPCTIMSMMSNNLLPAACEVDVCGTLSMHALALASQTPSALLDWNNNYGDDPNKAVCFHCSNLPKHFFQDVRVDFQEIIAGTVGKENAFGTVVGRVKPGAMSFARFSTDDSAGVIRGYVGEGLFTNDSLNTFGGVGVVQIAGLQKLLHYICENGFEHHVAANFSTTAAAVHEAAVRYLGWQMHWHGTA